MDNIVISNLDGNEWKKIRHKYHSLNKGMDKNIAAKILFEFDDIMKDNNIQYFLSCGTALGFYRDGNFIEWDDEIDVDVLSAKLMPKFDALKYNFLQKGFVVRTTNRGNTINMNVFKEGIKIAISSLDLQGKYRIYSNQKIPQHLYNDTHKFKYLDRAFNLPNPIDEYLTWYYGDWKTVIKSYEPKSYMNKNVWR